EAAIGGLFFLPWAANGGLLLMPWAAFWQPPFLSSGGLAPLQLLLGRGIDDVALGVDMASLGQAMPRHGGDAVQRTIAVECPRVVATALPRARVGAGAALVAGLGRCREREWSVGCHTGET